MILDEYPKEITLKDGSKLVLRPMVAEDEAALLAFFQGLSEGERLYLRDDVTDPEVVRGWAENVDYNRVLPVLPCARITNPFLGRRRLFVNAPKQTWQKNDVCSFIANSGRFSGLDL